MLKSISPAIVAVGIWGCVRVRTPSASSLWLWTDGYRQRIPASGHPLYLRFFLYLTLHICNTLHRIYLSFRARCARPYESQQLLDPKDTKTRK